MAKNAKDVAIKSRQTKLSKKSNEELIEIIIRKDKIERNLNNQITNLKGEVNSLTNRVSNFNKDQEGNIDAIHSLKLQLSELNDAYVRDNKYSAELENKYNTLKYYAVGATFTTIALAIAIFI